MSYVHAYTGISSVANNAAYNAIVAWVDECKAVACNAGESCTYVDSVLAQFAVARNVDELIQGLAQQDTAVRDYYADIINELYSLYYNGEWE